MLRGNRVIKIDDARYEVTVDGKEVHLAPKEFDLLLALYKKDGKVASREELADEIWGERAKANAIDSRTVDQHIARLRIKLGKRRDAIQTIQTRGYKFNKRA